MYILCQERKKKLPCWHLFHVGRAGVSKVPWMLAWNLQLLGSLSGNTLVSFILLIPCRSESIAGGSSSAKLRRMCMLPPFGNVQRTKHEWEPFSPPLHCQSLAGEKGTLPSVMAHLAHLPLHHHWCSSDLPFHWRSVLLK